MQGRSDEVKYILHYLRKPRNWRKGVLIFYIWRLWQQCIEDHNSKINYSDGYIKMRDNGRIIYVKQEIYIYINYRRSWTLDEYVRTGKGGTTSNAFFSNKNKISGLYVLNMWRPVHLVFWKWNIMCGTCICAYIFKFYCKCFIVIIVSMIRNLFSVRWI